MYQLYAELHRPQFHFTAKENWLNDPNGLVYVDGVWHLFFQHNPHATVWGNMTWGHAVSHDLMHWRQLEHALYPDEMGTMFSGSAVVDHHNSAGFGSGALLAFYTAAGSGASPARPFTQCLAYSLDAGENWVKYAANPVVDWIEDDNRDPKVIWHAPSRRWVMALYITADRYALLVSEDARHWRTTQEIVLTGDTECPDFFPLHDAAGVKRWVFWGASGRYLIGSFDGATFTVETEQQWCEQGANGYAAQTWSNAPDGRLVQVSWMAGGLYPEMPFNQQMSIPVELKLLGAGSSVRLARQPVAELATLYRRSVSAARVALNPGQPYVVDTQARLFDCNLTLSKDTAKALYIVVRGQTLTLDWHRGLLKFAGGRPHKLNSTVADIALPRADKLVLRLLVDLTCCEIFINDGALSASFCYLPDAYEHPLVLHSSGAVQSLDHLQLHELNSSWQ